MSQVHKRFSDDQVRVLFRGYCHGSLDRAAVCETLGIGKTRFFALAKQYREDPSLLTVAYERSSPGRLDLSLEVEIEKELMAEKSLVDDPRLPIDTYNYSAVRDRLHKRELDVALSTIINRAKRFGCYRQPKKRKAHDRRVETVAIGALLQHDASLHLWSPRIEEKWTLITTLDDFSRRLLYADFVRQETSWAHIKAAETVVTAFGLPLKYYVDSLRVFRFVQGRDSNWRKHVLQTDEADTQWRRMMRVLGVDVSYALSPQAKGKIERPYRWLQDRIVRTCALENIRTIDEARAVLKDEVSRYNDRQVHSTTGQIPAIRFEQAMKEGKDLFRPFALPKPYTSQRDVFSLSEKRTTDGYHRISLFRHDIHLPKVPTREEVDVRLIPDTAKSVVTVRIWWGGTLQYSLDHPMGDFPRVHF